MKLVFLIDNKGAYRYFSSLISESIKRNAEIELWHYCFSSKKIKIEDSPFYEIRKSSNVVFKKILSDLDVIDKINNSNNVDYFVSLHPVTFELSEGLLKIINGKWCIIQHGVDTFATLWHWHYFNFKGELLQKYNRLFFPYTDYFFKIGIDWMTKHADVNGKDNHKFLTENETAVFPIGSPMYEGDFNDEQMESIRKKFNIPSQKKILLYLPFPFYPIRAKYTKNGNYAWEAAFSGVHIRNTDLSNGTYSFIKSFVKKIIYVLKILLNNEARTWFFNKWSEPSIIQGIRKFCDINDLYLVVKPRKKFPFSEEVSRLADLVIDDDEMQFYPSKLQELFSVSALAIGYSTTSVFESIQNRVPFINIESPQALFNYEEARIDIHNYEENGKYNFKGVVYSVDVPSIIKSLHSNNIKDYLIDLEARDLYMEKFLGKGKQNAAINFCNILEGKIQSL
jgi:hypothetical protein